MAQEIRSVMSTNVVALDRKTSAGEAARRMREAAIGDVLVLSDGELCGILTDRDIVVRCVAAGADADSCEIGQIVSERPETLSPSDSVDSAIDLMRRRAIRRIPIVEKGRPVGILSLGDLAVERDRKSALGEISAAPPS